ncbi:hypothetical protein EIMP300_47470 [Escherichia coli]|uniref:SAM-dependent MTase RsmB/NOP-type domain-containing protein n=1 Tax=Escherichia coli TaxID=562 RepID=A0A8S0FSD9_ECOLX|nr:hypothetical protein EIMP300_47470 [Escherichia coli]
MLVAQHTVYFPDAFLTQMREAMPSTLSFDDFLAACQRPLRRSIRVNTLKTSVADFLQLTAPYGWTLTPIPWCEEGGAGFWIERDNEDALPLGSTAEHLSGLFYIQEASSMLPVAALFADGNAPQRVMDVAAAPGSKTTQIAARMNNEGAILANEFSASRVKVLHANISRCGISNVALTHFDGRVFGAAVPEMFDAILLDAPCSGEGVVRKDPDALKNWSPESNQEIAATQRELIDSAFHALRPARYAGLLDLYLKPGRKRSRLPVAERDLPRRSRVFTAWRSLPWCKQGADRGRLFACFPTNLRLRRLLRCSSA